MKEFPHTKDKEGLDLDANFQDQLFDAIDIITEEKMKNLSFNYCIEGVITSDTQNADGSYSFTYQDMVLTAFPLGNVLYNQGDIIYAMAISGDLSKKKIILTAKSRSGEQYLDIEKELEKTSKTGINYITNIESEFVLYSGTREMALSISPTLILDSRTQTFIRLSANIETNLEPTVGGNYGIAIKLKFEDDSEVEYALTMNEIIGNVYSNKGRQFTIEELYLDSVVKEVMYAKIFISGFPEDRPTEYIKFQRLSIDFVDSSVADVIHQISYKVEIFSTNGIVFKNGVLNTTLIARVYTGADDVTSTIDLSRFHWSRIDQNGSIETDWRVGSSSVTIDHSSVNNRATFTCEIADED